MARSSSPDPPRPETEATRSVPASHHAMWCMEPMVDPRVQSWQRWPPQVDECAAAHQPRPRHSPRCGRSAPKIFVDTSSKSQLPAKKVGPGGGGYVTFGSVIL